MKLPEVIAPKVTIAAKQDGFLPIVAAAVTNAEYKPGQQGHNTLLMAFVLDDEERALIAAGEDLYVGQLTFGGQLQAVLPMIGKARAAEAYGVEQSTPAILQARLRNVRAEMQQALETAAAAMLVSTNASGEQEKADAATIETEALTALDQVLTKLSHARVEAGVME